MRIERELYLIIHPVTSVDGLASCLEDLGVVLPGIEDTLPAPLVELVADANGLADQIADLLNDLSGSSDASEIQIILNIVQAGRGVFQLVQGLESVVTALELPDFPDPFHRPDFWEDLARRLPGYLLERWVRDHHPLAHNTLSLLGLWQTYPKTGINLGQINNFLSTPGPTLLGVIQNLDGEIDLRPIVAIVSDVVMLLGLAPVVDRRLYIDGVTIEDADAPNTGSGLGLRFLPRGLTDLATIDTTLGFDGQALTLSAGLSGATDATLPLNDAWTLRGNAAGGADIALRFSPATGLQTAPGAPFVAGGMSLRGAPEEPWKLIGFGDGAGISLGAAELSAEAMLSGSTQELIAKLSLEQLKLFIDLSESDSFIAEVLPIDGFEIGFDVNALWSSRTGLSVTALADTEFDIPLNLSLGPINIPLLRIGVIPSPDELEVWFGVSASADIAIIKAAIEDIGLRARLTRTSDGAGMLGDFDLTVSFRPPRGIGVAIGAPGSPISGGGYLRIDHAAGRYDGIIDLQIVKVGITAIVLLDTQELESGAWSMFFALFIELPSIQLGFGISLDGVGGVAGIHRTLDPDALLEAVRSGAMDTVLFPDNPIADAPVVIQTFRNLFPPAQGRYVFGPVIKLGWAKGVVSAELGTVIELPDPILVAILGSISIILPRLPEQADENAPETDEEFPTSVISLRLDVAGVFDFEAGTIAIDACLHNSSIVGFPIEGGMSLRAGFKDNPMFLLAVGGFHPGFPQPADFPIVPRLAMRIVVASIVNISFEAYFAVASNTVQFGSAIHLMADIEIFSIEGGFEFDALFEFNPLRVDIDLNMYVSVQAIGVDLLSVRLVGTADGPKPWVITAVAEVNIIGYRDGIEINKRNGGSASEPALPVAGIFDLLVEALTETSAWEGHAADGSPVVVAAVEEDVPGVRPDGSLTFAQKVAPLETNVEHYRRNTNLLHDHFTLELDVDEDIPVEDVTDWFAPGQFRNLGASDQAKLSAPSFEMMSSGKKITGRMRAPAARVATTTHKVSRLDPELGLDPELLADVVQASLDDLVDEETSRSTPTSGWVASESIDGIESITVEQPRFAGVSITSGHAVQNVPMSYMDVSARPDFQDVAIVRSFEMEGVQ